MASSFPTNLDSFTTKQDNVDNVLAAHVNDLQAAIVAAQTKIGINSSADTNSLDYKVANKVDKVDGSRLITSAESTLLGNTSGINTGDQTNISGTATNLSGTPDLPNGTTATTQSANDNSTKLATTAYVDGKASGSTFWTAVAGSPTRASNTTFTVTGDYTSLFKKGMVIKWTESSTVRNAMISIPSTYSSPNTTITIVGDTMASIDSSSLKYAMVGAENFIAKFAYAGNLGTVSTNIMNTFVAMEPYRVLAADLFVGTAGTTNNTTYDINKNGTTMFTTKPTLATTVQYSPTPFTADSATSLALGDVVTVDLDAIQTTNAIDGYIQLYLYPTRLNSLV